MKDRYEMHEGYDGSGNRIYLVVAVDVKGKWIYIEYFKNKKEALHWMKWA